VESLDSISPAIRYAAYDKATGQIIHLHSEFNVIENRFVEIPAAELTKMFGNDPEIVRRLSDNNPSNLDFIKIETTTASQPLRAARVDPIQKRLVVMPQLTVSSDKRQLAGDGQEVARIGISAVDEHGEVVTDASGTVKVTTTRGRLSSRGGIVELVNGHAVVELTAVNETVSSVRVEATSPEGKFASGHVDLEFI
jgi:hypothetical protein